MPRHHHIPPCAKSPCPAPTEWLEGGVDVRVTIEYDRAMEPLHALPETLFALRLRAGLTQSQLAERCGLTMHWISHFECGRRTPNVANLIRLADALGVTTDQLLGRSKIILMWP